MLIILIPFLSPPILAINPRRCLHFRVHPLDGHYNHNWHSDLRQWKLFTCTTSLHTHICES